MCQAKKKTHAKMDPPYKRTIFIGSKLDQDKLTFELNKINWLSVAPMQPIEAAAQSFGETIMSLATEKKRKYAF